LWSYNITLELFDLFRVESYLLAFFYWLWGIRHISFVQLCTKYIQKINKENADYWHVFFILQKKLKHYNVSGEYSIKK